MNRTISPSELKQLLENRKTILLLDVRRRVDYDTDGQKIPGAAWLDPERLTQWSTALPLDREIVIYCVRGADTARLDLAPQAPGLLALSLGLSQVFTDDHEMLRHGMVMYDALYAWCRDCRKETHGWPPKG